MFRRLVTDHWQAALALSLFVLAALGCVLQLLAVLRLPRDKAERGAALPLEPDNAPAQPAARRRP